jgi:hypothetical protein
MGIEISVTGAIASKIGYHPESGWYLEAARMGVML